MTDEAQRDGIRIAGWTEADIEDRLDRIAVWSDWLDGYAPNTHFHSRRRIARILSETPPPEIQADDRYRDGCRYFWIADAGPVTPIFLRAPRKFTVKAFQRALRQIRSRHPSAQIAVVEAIGNHRAVARFVNDGHLVWHMNADGDADRIDGRPYSTGTSTPLPTPAETPPEIGGAGRPSAPGMRR